MIKDFQIYGERSSGTNYTMGVFQHVTGLRNKCTFERPHHYGWKHFFYQPRFTEKIKSGNSYEANKNTFYSDDILFVCIVRDPYDWLHSLFRKRIHLPVELSENMEEFLLKEYWTTNRVSVNDKPETENLDDRNYNGERFKNIFEARKEKCNYLFHTVPKVVKNSVFVNYTTFIQDRESFMKKVCKDFGLPYHEQYPRVRATTYPVKNEEIKKIIDDNLDWKLENEMGFFKREGLTAE